VTRDEVEAFQRAHRNHLGKPLAVDGIIGAQTEWALDFVTLCHARRSVILAAQGYIGLREEPPGSNDDPSGAIRSWLARCGAAVGEPWCAAFTSWCLSQGIAEQVRQAGAVALGRRFPPTAYPVAGDLFWYPTNDRGNGHTGLVAGVAPLEVMTIEGNCANAVRCVRRDRAHLRFARTIEDVSGTPPGVVPSVPPAPGATR
jgi:hypothetical protein